MEKKTPFRSEMDKNDLQQANTLLQREKIYQNSSNFPNATVFAYVSLESIQTHECSGRQLYCFLLFRTVYYECYPMFSTSRTEFSFGLLCIVMDCSFLKIKTLRSDLEA